MSDVDSVLSWSRTVFPPLHTAGLVSFLDSRERGAGRGYGCRVDAACAAGAPASVMDQQHVRLLFQEVLLCGVHDAAGHCHHTDVHSEKRRQRY